MAFDFANIEDPHGYLANAREAPQRLLDWIHTTVADARERCSRLRLMYTDEDITNIRQKAINQSLGQSGPGRKMITGQEITLPYRITGLQLGELWKLGSTEIDPATLEKKRSAVRTENEIGWRVDTLAAYLFGDRDHERMLSFGPNDDADGDTLAPAIDLLETVLENQVEADWLGCLSETGMVYGFADVFVGLKEGAKWLVQTEPDGTEGATIGLEIDGEQASDPEVFARAVRWTIAKPETVVPMTPPREPSQPWGIVLAYETQTMPGAPLAEDETLRRRQVTGWLEFHTPEATRVFKSPPNSTDYVMVPTESAENPIWPEPLYTHILHKRDGDEYRGIGEVDPMIAAQTSLNMNLSDREFTVIMCAHPERWGRNIEDFASMPTGPDKRYALESPEAEIGVVEYETLDKGQEVAIEQAREALDKISRVPGVAAGLIQGKGIGNLESAAALRVVLSGLIAKVSKLRKSYARGLEAIAYKTLRLADIAGVLTLPEDFGRNSIRVRWAKTVEIDLAEKIQNASMAAGIGVSKRWILVNILGLSDADAETELTKSREEQAAAFSMAQEMQGGDLEGDAPEDET